ncbi:Cell surface glycoprotein CD200 receptor 1-A, partial [Acanthisitta chloris]
IGSNSQLACKLRPNLTVLTWKISPKVGGPCTLGYRADLNTTDRTNCSDSINWKFRPDLDAALEIRQVGIAQEGDYTCEIAATEGNYQERYYLTVLVHPRLSLYCDDRGTPVCEAAAGKPPAQVLWVVGSNSTPEEEGHKNGTVTVLSRFTEHSSNVINATCMVFHPAVNWSKSIVC